MVWFVCQVANCSRIACWGGKLTVYILCRAGCVLLIPPLCIPLFSLNFVVVRLCLVYHFGSFYNLFLFQRRPKCVCGILFGPFSNEQFWHILKILLKTDSKCVENVVSLKCILKQMHFKTDKSNVKKRTVSKQMYFKIDGKD